MTEEATNGDASPPNAKTMSLIAREAFEIDEYVRISDILHTRSFFQPCAHAGIDAALLCSSCV
jgi:hypothetical protein